MIVQLKIEAPINTTEYVTDITFGETVLVNLDCMECERCNRSVMLDRTSLFSYCTPTKHRFDGWVRELRSVKNSDATSTAIYIIEYEFKEFKDSKYPLRIPKPDSDWARVKFTMRCQCGLNSTHETQNNKARPFNIVCRCGEVLVHQVEEIPKISLIEQKKPRTLLQKMCGLNKGS
ncbi:hypothetical protein [Aliikangiella sp. IMCC44632]